MRGGGFLKEGDGMDGRPHLRAFFIHPDILTLQLSSYFFKGMRSFENMKLNSPSSALARILFVKIKSHLFLKHFGVWFPLVRRGERKGWETTSKLFPIEPHILILMYWHRYNMFSFWTAWVQPKFQLRPMSPYIPGPIVGSFCWILLGANEFC